ncbi:TIGR03086 family metal-binding protein [Crossiella sp. NPDC003009]
MSAEYVALVEAPLVGVVRKLTAASLGAATPCAEFDVRRLLNHLLFWGPSLAGAGRKESVPPPGVDEGAVDLVGEDWAGAVEGQVFRTVAAWGRDEAWVGMTWMGGENQLPAEVVGGMVVTELAVHAWDLARASGQDVQLDAGLVEFVHGQVVVSAQQGRDMGVYGPEVAVPEPAAVWERVLGLTGRDPGWTARS